MNKAVVFVFFILLLLANLASNQSNLEFQGFKILTWEKGEECQVDKKIPVPLLEKSHGTFVSAGHSGFCQSEIFFPPNIFELEYFQSNQQSGQIELVDVATSKTTRLKLSNPETPNPEDSGSIDWTRRWRTHRQLASKAKFPKGLQIRVNKQSQGEDSLIAVRSRVNFYKSSLHLPVINIYLILIIIFCFLLLNLKTLFQKLVSLKARSLFLLFLSLNLLLHFRFNHFFYWDEWHTLEQFYQGGFFSAFKRHNEHRVPLLFLFYFFEILILGSKYHAYLFISAVVHAVNCVLIAKLVRKIISDRLYASEVSIIAACFYSFSALHAETLRWSINQASLLSMCFVLLALNSFINYLKYSKKKDLIIFAASSAAAPLFFANGYALVFHLFLILLFARHKFISINAKKLFKLGFYFIVFMLIPVSIYALLSGGEGFDYKHIDDLGRPYDQIEQIKDYLIVGSQFATIIRGLGLFNSISQEAAFNIFGPGFVYGKYRPEEVFAICGSGVSLLWIVLCCFSKEPKRKLRFYIYGQLTIIFSLILPAIARSRFGSIQSLALRYQTQALLGLVIILIPWFEVCFKNILFSQRNSFIMKIVISFALVSQFHMAFTYDYFSSRGLRNRNYLQQIDDWKKNVEETLPQKSQVLHDPLLPANLTPKRTPTKIHLIYSLLQGGKDE